MIARLPSREITVAPTPFARSSLHWIGGSLFAAVKVTNTSSHGHRKSTPALANHDWGEGLDLPVLFYSLSLSTLLGQANDEKYVRLEEYRATAQLLRQQLEQQKGLEVVTATTVTEQDQAAMRPWSPEGGGGRPRVPDWMSLDDTLRYRFFGSPLVSASSVVLGGLGVGRG